MSRILFAVLLCGCGAPATSAKHAQADPPGDEGAKQATAPEQPAHEITGVNPIEDLDPQCKTSVDPLADGSLPIIENENQLEKLLGCDAWIELDWSLERLVPITLEGINEAWSYQGQSTQDGVTTIRILSAIMMRGAALHSHEFWLVRVPASTHSVVLDWTSEPMPANPPLYP